MALKKAALLSVTNKDQIEVVAAELAERGYAILSTGGTAKKLRENGVEVIDVSEVTGFPEMMDGRLKTIHPKVHGPILGRRGKDEAVMIANGMEYLIDVVIVNLYEFESTVAQGCTFEEAIEKIDIGGPGMMRASAKNLKSVYSVTSNEQYGALIMAIDSDDEILQLATRKKFAQETFRLTGKYDDAIATYLSSQSD